MNRSFRAQESSSSLLLDSAERQRQQLRASMMADKDEELSLFLEMRRREKEQDNSLLLNNNPREFDTPLGSKPGTSPVFNLSSGGGPAGRKTGPPDDFLNSEGDKNDYEWLLTPPGTPLFPSLEMESHRTMMSQSGDSKGRPATLSSRLANSSSEPAARNHLTSRQPTSSPGLSSSSGATRRPSSAICSICCSHMQSFYIISSIFSQVHNIKPCINYSSNSSNFFFTQNTHCSELIFVQESDD
ncbi:unnamed protein product [Eruca vesicaria subsp. sativa]|uniref:Uncharacterized protein n=1 Tax=Eruca vesicaria subsp. sativa TaxID=29727 RepID=A0ABC8LFC0_ERUVS|nr:unnamed protein product [Eruca vesicaria subsp. sativa]